MLVTIKPGDFLAVGSMVVHHTRTTKERMNCLYFFPDGPHAFFPGHHTIQSSIAKSGKMVREAFSGRQKQEKRKAIRKKNLMELERVQFFALRALFMWKDYSDNVSFRYLLKNVYGNLLTSTYVIIYE